MMQEDLEELLSDVCPSFEIRKDRKGQLVIYTGLRENETGELVDMTSRKEVDEDDDEEEDMNILDPMDMDLDELAENEDDED